MNTVIHLVRHAHAEWQPDENRPLSVRGRSDALRIATLLSASPISAIYSSPSARAIQTVAPLAERLHLTPVLEDDLRERELSAPTPGEFEAAVAESWRDPARAVTGGESNQAAQGRALAVVRRVLTSHAGESAVISTHGSLLVLILNGLDPSIGYEFWRSLTFPDVYELSFTDGALTELRRVWSAGA